METSFTPRCAAAAVASSTTQVKLKWTLHQAFPFSVSALPTLHADYAEYYTRYYTFYYGTLYSEKFAESTIQRGIDASGGRRGLAAHADADTVAAHTVLAGGV